jgi:hypothetical protein
MKLRVAGFSVAEIAVILEERPSHTRYCLAVFRDRLKRMLEGTD